MGSEFALGAVIAVSTYKQMRTEEQSAEFEAKQAEVQAQAIQTQIEETKMQAEQDELQRQTALADMLSSQTAIASASGLTGGTLASIQTESFKNAAKARSASEFLSRSRQKGLDVNRFGALGAAKYRRWLGKKQAESTLLKGVYTGAVLANSSSSGQGEGSG